MIQQLSTEERSSYHQIYRKDSLFSHWFSILSLNRTHIQCDPVSIWYSSQRVIDALRQVQEERHEMVEYLIDEMLSAHERNMVVATMCIVLTRLANAAEEGREEESHPNDPICVAIYRYFCNDPLFIGLLEKMKSKRTDNYGKKVVLTPNDPLTHESTTDDLPSAILTQMECMYQQVIQWTNPLTKLMKEDSYVRWCSMWQSICFDHELFELMKVVNPRQNQWGGNQKLVCNVLGLFNAQLNLRVPIQQLNSCLFTQNKSSYISNYKPQKGSDSVLTRELQNKICSFIAKTA